MKELYICCECGFLSTIRREFVLIHGDHYCKDCARDNHGIENEKDLQFKEIVYSNRLR